MSIQIYRIGNGCSSDACPSYLSAACQSSSGLWPADTKVVDGFNAPVTAGNFIDLVSRKFYDGLTVQRADGFIVQTGDPDGTVSRSTETVQKKQGRSASRSTCKQWCESCVIRRTIQLIP